MSNKQFNRIYSLIVGTKEDAIEINNLHIKFDVLKTSSNKDKKNSAQVEIYNLSSDRRKALEKPYVQVKLQVGYASTGLVTLFTGQVINISTSGITPYLTARRGADLVTRLDIDEFYTELNAKSVGRIIPEGGKVKDVIEEVVKSMEGVVRTRMNGNNVNITLPDGYPASGSPRQVLDALSKEYEIDWQIDDSVLYVSDRDGSYIRDKSGVPEIGQLSGLIGRPEFVNEDARRFRREVEGKAPKHAEPRKNSLKLKILLNPSIKAGSIIKLNFEDLTGYYKVSEVRHRGGYFENDWVSELTITEMA